MATHGGKGVGWIACPPALHGVGGLGRFLFQPPSFPSGREGFTPPLTPPLTPYPLHFYHIRFFGLHSVDNGARGPTHRPRTNRDTKPARRPTNRPLTDALAELWASPPFPPAASHLYVCVRVCVRVLVVHTCICKYARVHMCVYVCTEQIYVLIYDICRYVYMYI